MKHGLRAIAEAESESLRPGVKRRFRGTQRWYTSIIYLNTALEGILLKRLYTINEHKKTLGQQQPLGAPNFGTYSAHTLFHLHQNLDKTARQPLP